MRKSTTTTKKASTKKEDSKPSTPNTKSTKKSTQPKAAKPKTEEPAVKEAAKAINKNTETAAVDFTFELNKTSYFGEKVLVSGNIEELGRWNIQKAVSLTTNDETYPIWKTTIKIPADTYIEFKFLSIGNDGVSDTVTWEANENRAATVTENNTSYVGSWK